MKSIITDDLETCYICGAPRDHIHHIFYGTAITEIGEERLKNYLKEC